MLEWIIRNKEWLFSGIFIAIPIALIGWLVNLKKKKGKASDKLEMIQKSGRNSINIQSRDRIEINGDITNGTNSKSRK
jgi:hypothetical protein